MIFAIFMIVIVVLGAFGTMLQNENGDIPKNTKQREPLSGVVTKTDWYQDDLGWISSNKVMIKGLEDFYHETGIQPYVAMIPYQEPLWNGNDLNVSAANEYLEKLYDEEFADEGHFIFAYFSCRDDSISEMDGQFRYMAGYAADTIMDNEAISILWGYFNQYYYDTSYTTEQMIANTFSKTGEAIMSAPTNGWDFAKNAIFVVGGIAVVFIIYKVVKTKAQRAKEKEQYTKEILEKPLETFGEDTSDLEEKYK